MCNLLPRARVYKASCKQCHQEHHPLPALSPAFTRSPSGPVELEQVHPSLLLPPHDPACPISVLAGGACEPGDRVVVLRGTGAPPFGARGTVIGVLGDSVEVLMDEEYAGGWCAVRVWGRDSRRRPGRLPFINSMHSMHLQGATFCGGALSWVISTLQQK